MVQFTHWPNGSVQADFTWVLYGDMVIDDGEF